MKGAKSICSREFMWQLLVTVYKNILMDEKPNFNAVGLQDRYRRYLCPARRSRYGMLP